MSTSFEDHTTDLRLLEKLNEGVLTTDEFGIILATNPSMDKLFGYGPGELIGHNVSSLMPLNHAMMHDRKIEEFKKTNSSVIVGEGRKVYGKRKNGETFPLYISISQVKSDTGETRFVAFLYDKSKEYRYQVEIENQRSFFKSILENIPDAIVLSDADRTITMVNPAFNELFDYSAEELEGQKTRILYQSETDFMMLGRVARFPRSKKPYENVNIIKYLKKNGEDFFGETIISAVTDDDKNIISYIAVIRDISKRLENQNKLNDLLSYNRILLDGMPVSCALSTFEGDFIEVNDQFLNLIGQDKQDFYRHSFFSLIHENDRSQIESLFLQSEKEKEYGPVEATFWKANGETVTILMRGQTVSLGGKDLLWSVLEDVSDYRATQDRLREARDEAERANRAKSDFLSAMSHELRTPLNAIIGFSQLMEFSKANPLNDSQKNQIREIHSAGEHLLILVDEVLDLSRVESGNLQMKHEKVLLDDFIKPVLDLLRLQAEAKNIYLINDLMGSDEMVWADTLRLKQCLVNLLSNGIKYNKTGGSVRISGEALDNIYFRILVEDTGVGIEAGSQNQVFEAFNRLGKEEADIEGTGIGLVITKRYVEAMNGRIGFDSREGRGTKFWIDLPVVKG